MTSSKPYCWQSSYQRICHKQVCDYSEHGSAIPELLSGAVSLAAPPAASSVEALLCWWCSCPASWAKGLGNGFWGLPVLAPIWVDTSLGLLGAGSGDAGLLCCWLTRSCARCLCPLQQCEQSHTNICQDLCSRYTLPATSLCKQNHTKVRILTAGRLRDERTRAWRTRCTRLLNAGSHKRLLLQQGALQNPKTVLTCISIVYMEYMWTTTFVTQSKASVTSKHCARVQVRSAVCQSICQFAGNAFYGAGLQDSSGTLGLTPNGTPDALC